MLASPFARMGPRIIAARQFPARRSRARAAGAAALCVVAAACAARGTAASAPPVVVQGAMDVEVRALAGAVDGAREERIAGWTFWRGTIDGYPVVVSKTLKGMENAAAATVLAIEHYRPAAIVNQGTAGGHQPDLHVYDIVVGVEAVNLGAFKTGFRARGDGSRFDDWQPLDLMRSDGSAGQDPNARTMRRFRGDARLVDAAHAASRLYTRGRVVDGVIGSSEIWNSELDRVDRLHTQFGTTAEEMETAAAAQIAGLFGVPFVGIRVVSNNITNGDAYDTRTADACQQYVREVVRRYVDGLKR
jgi:adenosylhomocysteine nucleosidase